MNDERFIRVIIKEKNSVIMDIELDFKHLKKYLKLIEDILSEIWA